MANTANTANTAKGVNNGRYGLTVINTPCSGLPSGLARTGLMQVSYYYYYAITVH